MPVWELYYHLIFGTTERWPYIDPEMEPILYRLLLEKANELDSTVYGINGIRDHVHIVASIPPDISVAAFVEEIRRYASENIRKWDPRYAQFSWQLDYGAFSFGRKHLDTVLNYVSNQKSHHQNGTINRLLETWDESEWQIREQDGVYNTESEDIF